MTNFNWTTFTRKIPIKATLQDLYKAWTIPEQIENWFLSKAVFINENHQTIGRNESIQKGDTYEWNWFLYDLTQIGKVTEANGTNYLQFTFAGECLVDILLEEKEGSVIVQLTQKEIPTDDESKQNIRLGCHTGWSFFLVNLKSVYEGGLDLRNKDNNLKGMLNC